MAVRKIIKQIAPHWFPRVFRAGRNNAPPSGYGLSGDYRSWREALRDSAGYDREIILEKTKEAQLKVKRGEAVYARDSVLFSEIQYSWPLLAGLMWVAAQSGGKLNVLDFGGSLGTGYFQNLAFLRRLPEVRWNIVEQSRWVETGRESFESDQLKFYLSVEDCWAETRPNLVILGSVLQYLEHPYEILDKLKEFSCDNIIIDRTPFWNGSADLLCVENVPPGIYPASYPSWIFSRRVFLAQLNAEWRIIAEFENPDRLAGPVEFSYRGIMVVRRPAPVPAGPGGS